MHVIRARNVSEALPAGVQYLLENGIRENSRAGEVLVAPTPVTTVYTHPQERVLLSSVRDANPFFHLAEIAWMLAGRDDAALLNNFVADFGQRFAESASGAANVEDDGRIHGAYGKRWRREFGIDQLDWVVDILTKQPESRQAVIQMWDARPRQPRNVTLDGRETVLTVGCSDLIGNWKDRPCNTHAYLRVRTEERGHVMAMGDVIGRPEAVLDMTVLCRSNDIIWGAYGANAVHFSALQEYLATRVGVGVGTYYQVSNNFHAYTAELERLRQRAQVGVGGLSMRALPERLTDYRIIPTQPLVENHQTFDAELTTVLRAYEDRLEITGQFHNRFLGGTLRTALAAHRLWKTAQKHSAMKMAKVIEAKDWRAACVEWMERRTK